MAMYITVKIHPGTSFDQEHGPTALGDTVIIKNVFNALINAEGEVVKMEIK